MVYCCAYLRRKGRVPGLCDVMLLVTGRARGMNVLNQA